MKQPEKYYCDICKEEIIITSNDSSTDTGYINKPVDVITSCEWTEGHSAKPHNAVLKVDICKKCYLKSIGLECSFRGQDLKFRYN